MFIFYLSVLIFIYQIIMPGYCVAGTVGWKILNGQRKLEFENRQTVSVKSSSLSCGCLSWL